MQKYSRPHAAFPTPELNPQPQARNETADCSSQRERPRFPPGRLLLQTQDRGRFQTCLAAGKGRLAILEQGFCLDTVWLVFQGYPKRDTAVMDNVIA